MSKKREDLTGKRFGQLTVLGPAEDANGKARWLCRCDCGKEKITYGSNLKKGTTKSCGCLGLELKRRKKDNYQEAARRWQTCPKTLCVSCIRSAAPPELQCIWDKSGARVLPEGVKTVVVYKKSSGGVDYPIVTDCPEYLSIHKANNQRLLKEARKRNLALMALENNVGNYTLPRELAEVL